MAVRIMTAASGSIQWICRRTSIPSRPGMQMSRRVKRGRRLENSSRACSPFDARITSCPWLLSTTCSSSQINRSSSTTKIEAMMIPFFYMRKKDRSVNVHFCSRVFRRRLPLCSHSSYILLKNSRIIDGIAFPSRLSPRDFLNRPSVEMEMPCQNGGQEMCGRTKVCQLDGADLRVSRGEQSAADACQEVHVVRDSASSGKRSGPVTETRQVRAIRCISVNGTSEYLMSAGDTRAD